MLGGVGIAKIVRAAKSIVSHYDVAPLMHSLRICRLGSTSGHKRCVWPARELLLTLKRRLLTERLFKVLPKVSRFAVDRVHLFRMLSQVLLLLD